MPKFFDNRIRPNLPGNASPDRYELLGLRDSEPNLGVPGVDGYILSSDLDGNRSWIAPAVVGSYIETSLITAKGDIVVGLLSNTPARLPVGANGKVLYADSAETLGLKWDNLPASISPTIINAKGDIIVGQSDDTPSTLSAGTNGYVLTADSAQPLGVKWGALPASISPTIINAKGDIIVGQSDDTPSILSVGTNGYVLTADNTQSLGIKWGSLPASISPTIINAKGDIIVGQSDDTPSVLTAGSNGYVLTADSTQSLGVKWTAPSSILSITTLTATSGSLAAGATYDFTLSGTSFLLVNITTDYPSWIRGYSSSAARAADTRTSPGSPYPAAGSGFYAEVVTASGALSVEMSPAPIIYGPSGTSYWRLVNNDVVSRTISMSFTVIPFVS